MIIVCDKCQKKYNVDEERIPDQGIKVRCTQCGNILFIKKPAPVEEKVEEKVEEEPVKEEEPVREEVEEEVEEKVEEEPVKEEGMGEGKKAEWQKRAKRLARALAKDLLLYHGPKVEQGLQDGSLARLIGGEIRRSWEYYCQQVPQEIRLEYDYFKEALNEILGKGKTIFK